jgi:hypothetical protein
MNLAVDVLQLHPPTGFDVATRSSSQSSPSESPSEMDIRIYFLQKFDWRSQYWDHVAHVNKVKVIAVHPAILDVVDDKLDVGWYPYGLDGTQVDTRDLGTGELLANWKKVSTAYIMTGDHVSVPSIAQVPVPVPKSSIFWGC